MQINFLGGSSAGRSIAVDTQESMNLYPELRNAASKGNVILIGTPGLEYLTRGTNGAVRGLITTGSDRLFAVIGEKFVEVNGDLTVSTIGTLNTSSGIVSMAENVSTTSLTTQIVVVDGIDGYVYKQSDGTFEVITDASYLSGTHIAWIGGYFVQNVVGENKFIYSDLYSGTTWSAFYYAAEGNPDNCDALATVNNELFLFGKKAMEVWSITGDSLNPFERVNNAFVDIGVKAIRSIVKIGNGLFWLGANAEGENIVWSASNYIPQKISTNAQEFAISQIADASDCVAYSYQQEGHNFYVMNFISGKKTLVYDLSTGLWHNRSYFDPYEYEHVSHRGQCAVLWGGQVVVGDRVGPLLYKYNLDYYTDNGKTIVRYRQGPHIHDDMKRLFFQNFEIDIERGLGSEAGSDPQIMMQFSDDGGYTWSNELWQTLGKIGERVTRVVWNRLGMSRDRVFKVTFSDAVKIVLIGASANIIKANE